MTHEYSMKMDYIPDKVKCILYSQGQEEICSDIISYSYAIIKR